MLAIMSAGMSPARSCMAQLADRQAERAAERDQDQSLGHELADQADARCTQRAADGDLALPALSANQQQARDVHARDQEQQSGAAEQHQQDRTNRRRQSRRPGARRSRPDRGWSRGTAFPAAWQSSSSRQGPPRSKTPSFSRPIPYEAVAAAPQVTPARRVKRGPELGASPRRELKLRRQHADDGVRTRR